MTQHQLGSLLASLPFFVILIAIIWWLLRDPRARRPFFITLVVVVLFFACWIGGCALQLDFTAADWQRMKGPR